MSALPIIETHDAPIVSTIFATSSGTGSCSKRTSSRQQKHSLPKTFLIYDIAVHMIVGACLVTSCLKGDSASSVKWEVARACLLQEFRRIEKADCIYMSNVFQLKPACEQSIRLSRCTIGGTLNCHFIVYAGDMWKVLSFDSAAIAMFRNSHGIFLVTTGFAHAGKLGIVPTEEAVASQAAAVASSALAMLEDSCDQVWEVLQTITFKQLSTD